MLLKTNIGFLKNDNKKIVYYYSRIMKIVRPKNNFIYQVE